MSYRLFGIIFFCCTLSSIHAQTTVFTDVNVVPMNTERVLEHCTVLIQGDRIVQIEPYQAKQWEADVLVIPSSGKYLLPGLADMHVHTWMVDDLTLFVCNGVTTIRNLFGSPMHLLWKKNIADKDFFAPNIITAGPIIDGEPPIWPGSAVPKDAAEAREIVREQRAAGYDMIKVYNRLPKEIYLAIIDEAGKQNIPVVGHVPDAVGLELALEKKQKSIEHFSGYSLFLVADNGTTLTANEKRKEYLAWLEMDEKKLAPWVAKTAAAGTWMCPTLIVFEKWLDHALAEKIEKTKPYVQYVSTWTMQFWDNMHKNTDAQVAQKIRDGHANRQKFLKSMVEGNIKVILGTDMGNPWVAAGFSVHEELENFVEAGLTPYQALRTATLAPAEFLEQTEEFGTVEAGKRADLILADANPLQDIATLREPAGVMLRGKWFTREELASKLQKIAQRYKQ